MCVCVILLYSYQLGGQGSPLSMSRQQKMNSGGVYGYKDQVLKGFAIDGNEDFKERTT